LRQSELGEGGGREGGVRARSSEFATGRISKFRPREKKRAAPKHKRQPVNWRKGERKPVNNLQIVLCLERKRKVEGVRRFSY